MRACRGFFAFFLVAAAFAIASAAQAQPAPRSLDALAPGIVQLTLNGIDRGDVLAIVDADAYRIWISSSDAKRLNLEVDRLTIRGTYREQLFVLLPRLADAEFEFDARKQAARVSIAASLVGHYDRLALHKQAKAARIQSPALTLSYDVNAERRGGQPATGAIVSARASSEMGRLTTSYSLTQAPALQMSKSIVARRLDTTYTLDFPERLTSLRVGDFVSRDNGLLPALKMGGVQYGTDNGLAPDRITYPQASINGEAVLPSTGELFVNGVAVGSRAVAPGLFSYSDIPIVSGEGDLRLVVRDPLGREQIVERSFYSNPALLTRGSHEYSVAVGSPRFNLGDDDAYRQWLALINSRYGITNTLTANAGAQVGRRFAHASAGLTSVLFNRFSADLQVAGSLYSLPAGPPGDTDRRLQGMAARLAIERNSRRYGLGASYRWLSENYRDASIIGAEQSAISGSPRSEFNAFGTAGLGVSSSVSLAYSRQLRQIAANNLSNLALAPEATRASALSLTFSTSLPRGASLSLSANRYEDNGLTKTPRTSAFLSVSMPLEGRRFASASLRGLRETSVGGADRSRTETVPQLSVQQSLPDGEGLGWRFSVGGDRELRAQMQYAARFATGTLDYAQFDASRGIRVGATGALAWIGGELYASRAPEESFVLVDAGEAADTRVYFNNRDMGRTNARGKLIIPRVAPEIDHRVALEPADLSMTALADDTVRNFRIARESGGIVSFRVNATGSGLLSIVDETGKPLGDDVVAHVGNRSFPVALNGDVFVTGLEGPTTIVVKQRERVCSIQVDAAAKASAGANLGVYLGAFTCLLKTP